MAEIDLIVAAASVVAVALTLLVICKAHGMTITVDSEGASAEQLRYRPRARYDTCSGAI
jgi:hypothetical protein